MIYNLHFLTRNSHLYFFVKLRPNYVFIFTGLISEHFLPSMPDVFSLARGEKSKECKHRNAELFPKRTKKSLAPGVRFSL